MAKKVEAPPPKSGGRVQVVDHKAKVPFWKPKSVGEKLIGKLIAVVVGQEGRKSMRIVTPTGAISVGINFALANVIWENYVGSQVELIYTGEVGQRHGRTYDAFVTEPEDAPF